MPLTPDFMRWSLLICIISMNLLAFFYLRRRQLSPAIDLGWQAYFGWGLLSVLIPLLGPFLIILIHPGKKLTS